MGLGHVFMTAANAVLPILLLILVGFTLRKIGWVSESFTKTGNKLVFNVFLPAMLFINVYDIDGISAIKWDVVLFVVAVICLLFILAIFIAVFATKIPERRGVIMQCVYRSNFAIIGMPLAAALGGDEAMAITAVISAFSIPLYNLFSVIALTMFLKDEQGNQRSLKAVILDIVSNPLILSVAAGFVFLGLRQLQTEWFGSVVFTLKGNLKFLYTALNNLKSIASPLALVVMGAQFEFSAVKGMFKEIAAGTLSRLVIAPVVGIGLAILLSTRTGLLSCGPSEYPALVALYGSPMAVSAAVMAGQMRNDQQLATQLVVWTSVFSILTVFLTVCIMMPAGLLAS